MTASLRPVLPILLALLLIAAAGGGVRHFHYTLPYAEIWAEGESGPDSPAAQNERADAYRADYGFRDEAGRWTSLPVGHDSYYFMRMARRIAATGTPCTPGLDGCHDDLASAPTGRPVLDAWSPHPHAIAGVHRLWTAIDPARPILDSARVHAWLMMTLGGLTAFFLVRSAVGRGFPGWAGGVTAAIGLCLNPLIIQRTFGADDDVWILALMLAGGLCAVRAFDPAGAGIRRAAWAASAGAMAGTLSLAWGGWPFLAVVMTGLGLTAVVWPFIRPRPLRAWREGACAVLLVAAMILVMGAIAAVQITADDLRAFLAIAANTVGTGAEPPPVDATPVPDAFASVAELTEPAWSDIARTIGWVMGGLAVVGLAAAAWKIVRRIGGWFPAAWILPVVWLLAGLSLAGDAERFGILLFPPVAILSGAGLAVVLSLLAGAQRNRGATQTRPAIAATAMTCIVVLVPVLVWGAAVWRGIETVSGNRPALGQRWVSVFSQLRDDSAEDAVLIGWWDVGHWATFWAERATVLDGATIGSPRTPAVARLLGADADGPIGALVASSACPDGENPIGCGTRELYLLTSSDLLSIDGWMIAGFWDAERARLLDSFAAGDRTQNHSPEMQSEMAGVTSRRQRALFAAPQARIWSRDWHDCTVDENGRYDCGLDIGSADGWRLVSFRFDPAAPEEAHLILQPPESGDGTSGDRTTARPAMLRVATASSLIEFHATPGSTRPGVLVDTAEQRVFVGMQPLLKSLVARLVLLDGRFDDHRATSVAQSTGLEGGTVRAWRLRLPESPDESLDETGPN